ncbi:MAG TPA: 2-alkenal reductase, partial [Gammaproteobacteria bacterium]|nr:2-alkenal reductase [Gammaproteobacteria bacterium]
MTLRQSNVGMDWIGPVSYAAAVSRAAPSVVNIYTLQAARSRSDPSNRISLGSGVIMQSDGLVLTNHHVIEGAVKILVLLYDGRELPATVVGTDPEIDLAVLKIEADNLSP